MDMTKAGIIKGHSGQVLGVAHSFAGNDIIAVGHGRSEMLGSMAFSAAESVIGVAIVET
jgi:hypothetical protein